MVVYDQTSTKSSLNFTFWKFLEHSELVTNVTTFHMDYSIWFKMWNYISARMSSISLTSARKNAIVEFYKRQHDAPLDLFIPQTNLFYWPNFQHWIPFQTNDSTPVKTSMASKSFSLSLNCFLGLRVGF